MNNLKLSDLIEKIIDNRGKNPDYYCEEGIPVIDNYLIHPFGVDIDDKTPLKHLSWCIVD